MTTLTITFPESNPVIWRRLEELIGLGATIETAEHSERIPGLPYTPEERIASARRAVADYRAGGRTYTSEELREKMAEW